MIASRFTRTTVNIGVSGAARMGKSTLLQSISGLDDNQIPTGHGIPVTAVRSRIFHSPSVRRAELDLHSPESFLTAVISPLHAALDLSPAPRTVAEFRDSVYPEALPDTRHRVLLTRLRELQSALMSYEPLLTGGVKTVPAGGGAAVRGVSDPRGDLQGGRAGGARLCGCPRDPHRVCLPA
ncbi:hypothetical protein [Streptomyces phaeochromogenes]|uniref:hypothetical protein n=1 Tax=Streptomyces phaeochromogenes TaxID=1923 RepID=UPI0033E69BA9